MAKVTVKEIRGMRIRMGRHSSEVTSDEGSAPGTYDIDSKQPV